MHHPHRLDAESCRGHYQHFLTICTHQRCQYFLDGAVVDAVRSQILRAATAESFAVLAYCYMPDHVHAVVHGLTETADLHRFVRLAKQRSGYVVRRTTGRRLWQSSYFDRTLRLDESLADIVRYVINNPVRAGSVDAPAKYPHWGSEVYSREEIEDFVGSHVPRV